MSLQKTAFEAPPMPAEGIDRSKSIERAVRSEEHTSELQSHSDLVCRLLLEKKKKTDRHRISKTRYAAKIGVTPIAMVPCQRPATHVTRCRTNSRAPA